ncbi:MAG: phage holin family protein [Filimonas sp.]|nr:phage holin family protein [Filimonas sp.]
MNLTYAKSVLLKINSTFLNSSVGSWIIKSATAIWLYFAGIHNYLFIVFALTLLDVVTGVMASIKKGEKFKSRILRKGLLEKFLLYLIIMLAIFFLETLGKSIIQYDKFYFVFIGTFLISTYEVVSILENILVLNPKLLFISSLIKLTNSLQSKAIEKSEKAIETAANEFGKDNKTQSEGV